MCMPATGGGPFGPASVPPRSPAARQGAASARRATRLTLPLPERSTSPDLASQPRSNGLAAAEPVGRLLQLGGLAAGLAPGAGRAVPGLRTAQAPQSETAPAAPGARPRALRPDVVGDASADGLLILKQVSEGKLGPADAMVSFEELLSHRNVSPAARRELNLTFGENLARAIRRRFSIHDALQEVSADPQAQTIDGDEVLAPSGNLQSETNLAEQTADVVSQGASGFNTGLAQGAGLPVDMMTLGLNLLSRRVRAATGLDIGGIERPFLGSQQIQELLDAADAIAPPSDNTVGQFARRTGESVGAAALPGAGVVGASGRLVQQAGRQAIPLMRQAANSPGTFLAAELGVGAAGGAGAATGIGSCLTALWRTSWVR